MKISLQFALVLALSVTGCTKAVTIIEPAPGKPIKAPLTEFRVQFSTWFNPGTFRAELDGDDVTAQFSPVAAKGGTSLMRMPDTLDGFKFGTWIPTSPPPPPPPVGALPSDIHFTPAVGPPTVPPPPTGTGTPAPNIAMYTHLLHVTASCWGLICSVADDLVFFPPHIVGLPTDLNVRIGMTEQARVEIYPALSTAVPVRITPTTGSVRLSGGAAGAPITIMVPAGGSAPFSITGVVSSNMVLFLEGRGLQRGAISGVVNP